MAAQGSQTFGITDPLSTAPPTEQENQYSNTLIEELKRQNNYESAAETQKRSKVLQSLQKITEEFVKQVSRDQGLTESVAKSKGGKILTFGSYKLGVIGPGSDIDTLVVCPKNITKSDFFNKFPDLLVKLADEGPIEELTAKPDAFAPCITLKYGGIDIDLLFGRVEESQVTADISLLNQNMLRGLNEQEVRSLNGIRVADEILNLVPQPSIFRTALRTIKLWGTRRAIAGNIYGFPGGVAWAILVARICQLYPKATASVIVTKFFQIMKQWAWPQPVLLKKIEAGGQLPLKVWNPKIYPSDRNHIMPIITPAYPSMCTTHNFTRSTKTVIDREFVRGHDIALKVMNGKASWKDLFVKHTFFTQGYKHYLSIISASKSKETQMIWSGFVESKVRLLVGKLEQHASIVLAHPFNKGFTRVHRCRSDDEVDQVKIGSLKYHATDIATVTTGHGLALEPMVKDEAGVEKKVEEEDVTYVYTATHYIGLEVREGARSLDLSYEIDDFKRLCTSSELYNDEENSLGVANTRNFDLPDDVFGEGEVKPVRTLKSKKKPQSTEKKPQATEKKRQATEDNNEAPAKRQQPTSVAAAG